ncbi:MAG TPA: sigma-70 family RNA polymerase sigma factor [Pyrinomonadaceae bacterium]|nr:sigma-70 family RNA polymerase sigma factor [Pyrinomonadaceae bacterium]
MQSPQPAPSTQQVHEELVLRLYDQLLLWALPLTGNNREQAEDLVHDVLVQFELSCDPQSIWNLDGYLFTMLKNLRLARMRRAAQAHSVDLSILDYESAELGLVNHGDVRLRLQVQDELRRVCQYACLRRETSKAGSVLILRFFHGYYPSEIARILQMSRHAVDEQLRLARAEARLFLDDPNRLQFLSGFEFDRAKRPHLRSALKTSDILLDLRDSIFTTCRGECLSTAQLKSIYEKDNGEMRETSRSAHVVSCPTCLQEVNRVLGLPALEDRYPTDLLEPEKTDRSDKGGPSIPKHGGGSVGGTTSRSAIKRHRREMKKVREHRPQELRIAVNGFILGSQRVGLELNEQTLSIKGEEKIGFIEVLSEQGVRLLFLNVDAPPDGEVEHKAWVGLSEGRELELSLNFSGPWPTVNVIYSDPTAAPLSNAIIQTTPRHSEESQISKVKIDAHNSESTVHSLLEKASKISGNLSAWIARLVRPGRNLGVWNPDLRRLALSGAAIAVIALIGVAVHWVVTLRSPVPAVKPTAAELLARSAIADGALIAGGDQVVHRSIAFEAREVRGSRSTGQLGSSSSDGLLIARRRIDIWQSGEKGVAARRIYDERNHLIAGHWATGDGRRTIYHHQREPRPEIETDKSIDLLLAEERVWQLDVSAEEFSALIAGNDRAHVEERGNVYVIRYEALSAAEPASAASSKAATTLIGATLDLGRADLHATQLILLVRKGEPGSQSVPGQLLEYTFTEMSFERHPASSVAPGAFEPEPELTAKHAKSITRRLVTPPPAIPAAPVVTAALEIRVLDLLNRIGADLGQEVIVTRIPGEVLRLEAVVDTEQRKGEILSALAPVTNNLAVQMQIETAAEAQERILKQPLAPTAGVITTETVTANTIAVQAEVRRYVLSRGFPEYQVDTEVGRIANQVLMLSHRAMLHVWALKSLVGRFTLQDLETLDAETRAKWLRMVQLHAHDFQREAQGLRRDLALIFNAPDGGGSQRPGERGGDAQLAQTISLLISQASANHEIVQSAFTVSPRGHSLSVITTPQFWQSLDLANQLAGQIQNSASSTR